MFESVFRGRFFYGKWETDAAQAGRALAVSLGIYLAGHLLLAALLVRGTVGEGVAFAVTAGLCVISSAVGALLAAGQAGMGRLPGAMLAAALFVCALIAVGALAWQGITWTGHGGILILCALAGGLLAGLLGGRKRGGKRRRR